MIMSKLKFGHNSKLESTLPKDITLYTALEKYYKLSERQYAWSDYIRFELL